jgi:hypothetical protein
VNGSGPEPLLKELSCYTEAGTFAPDIDEMDIAPRDLEPYLLHLANRVPESERIPRLLAAYHLMKFLKEPCPDLAATLIQSLVREGSEEYLLHAVDVYREHQINRRNRPPIEALLKSTRFEEISLLELTRVLEGIQDENANAIKHEVGETELDPSRKHHLEALMHQRMEGARLAFLKGRPISAIRSSIEENTVPWVTALLTYGKESPLLGVEALHLLVSRPALLGQPAVRTALNELTLNGVPAADLLQRFKQAGSGRELTFERPVKVQFYCANGDTISPGYRDRFKKFVEESQRINGLEISPGPSMDFNGKPVLPPETSIIERLLDRDYVVIVIDGEVRKPYETAISELSDPDLRAQLIQRLRREGHGDLANRLSQPHLRIPKLYFATDIFPPSTEDPLQLLPLLDRIILDETSEKHNSLVIKR